MIGLKYEPSFVATVNLKKEKRAKASKNTQNPVKSVRKLWTWKTEKHTDFALQLEYKTKKISDCLVSDLNIRLLNLA